MSDVPPSDAFPDLCSADDHSHFGQQQQLPDPPQSVTPVRILLYGSCPITVTGTTIYIPQSIYQLYTEADCVRYVEKADLKEPVIFKTAHPDQWGIALNDTLKAKMKDLLDKDDNMVENCRP
ncbi:uncharacterized protein F5147DRAFT_788497 [Suillus discolor]|uniref:Uncharacterized protein n=1 Tax=Suillus discolor TaxID=1912936 RepID=A0A9P7ESV5_9AGAM|nr:uncharacterized protein F5147DRAFT_788497 [Suillus discolor]KAG2089125.1 hypothetical protein F5147DRAFT_788497 [Suillus discolor]